ncbi:MAG TPA: Spy/CpxP family protein refolding chaperone [Candidatus Polarisedimenticolaceae bacterium]|nr:Spy/CpxP family protein refolding chaperone [Candidatus Polarisedimenticolaceae bacterium]
MRLTSIACAALVVTGTTLAAPNLDPPPSPPAPPVPLSAPMPPLPPSPPDMALGLGGRILHELDLTAGQRSQIRTLVRTARDQGLGEAFEAAHAARQALERALWSPGTDESRLGALRQEAEEAETHLLEARLKLARDVLQVLTEEQRTEFLQLLAETPGWGPPRP